MKGNSLPVMRDFFFGGRARRPRITIPVDDPLPAWATPVRRRDCASPGSGTARSSLEIDGVRVLTDPVFGDARVARLVRGAEALSPGAGDDRAAAAARRGAALARSPRSSRPGRASASSRDARLPFVTSLGVGAHLERLGVDARLITELDWWEEHTLAGGALSFTATPAQHFSGRGLFDRNRTLWSSWVLATEPRVVSSSRPTPGSPTSCATSASGSARST